MIIIDSSIVKWGVEQRGIITHLHACTHTHTYTTHTQTHTHLEVDEFGKTRLVDECMMEVGADETPDLSEGGQLRTKRRLQLNMRKKTIT